MSTRYGKVHCTVCGEEGHNKRSHKDDNEPVKDGEDEYDSEEYDADGEDQHGNYEPKVDFKASSRPPKLPVSVN